MTCPRDATQSDSSSWSSTRFRHAPWESLTIYGQAFVGSVTAVLVFVGQFAWTGGDALAVAVAFLAWAGCMALLAFSTSYRPPPIVVASPEPPPAPVQPCRRHPGNVRPARPRAHRTPVLNQGA